MKVLASLLVTLLLFQACAGSVAGKPNRTPSVAPDAGQSDDQMEGVRETTTPKRKLWPWAVGGVALGAVAAGVLVGILAYSISHMFDDTDFSGLGKGSSGSNGGNGNTIPVVASR